MSEESKVKVRNLTKSFGDLLVLDDISFDIKKGDFVCIVGPTGCGKTTFLNLLVKLIESNCSSEVLTIAAQYCPSPSTCPGTRLYPCSVLIIPSKPSARFSCTTQAPSSDAIHATLRSFSYRLKVHVEYMNVPP